MNRAMRRAAGTQKQKTTRETAAEQLAAVCPDGWRPELVVPPWAEERTRCCRSCGGTSPEKWAVMMLTRKDPERQVLRFTFASVCVTCGTHEETMQRLGDRVFGPRDGEAST